MFRLRYFGSDVALSPKPTRNVSLFIAASLSCQPLSVITNIGNKLHPECKVENLLLKQIGSRGTERGLPERVSEPVKLLSEFLANMPAREVWGVFGVKAPGASLEVTKTPSLEGPDMTNEV